MSHAILEVIDGPMDGLSALISKSGSVGRGVGATLTLPFDLEISGRHVEVVLEGSTWCLRDQKSTNGTWYRCERLHPGQSYPVANKEILLIGSTTVQLHIGETDHIPLTLTDAGHADPREVFSMTEEVGNVWSRLLTNIGNQGEFCDTTKFFLCLLEEKFGQHCANFFSYNQLKSNNKFRIIHSWLKNADFQPFYQLAPQALTIAPRVWRILETATSIAQERIDFTCVIKALSLDLHCLAGLHLQQDLPLLEACGLIPPRKKITSQPSQPIRTQQEPVVEKVTGDNEVLKTSGSTSEIDPLCEFGTRIERLVQGFLDDAENPVAGGDSSITHSPKLKRKLSEVLTIPDPEQKNLILQEHLEIIYNLLIAVLASQKEGSTIYATALAQRIEKAITRPNNNALSMRKKKIDSADVVNGIRGTLTRADSSGLSEKIVRDILTEKINAFGLGR